MSQIFKHIVEAVSEKTMQLIGLGNLDLCYLVLFRISCLEYSNLQSSKLCNT